MDSSSNGIRSQVARLDRQSILRAHPWFAKMERPVIEQLASYSVTQQVPRGATIFRKGDPGTSLYAVCTGTVKISVPSVDGKDAVFNVMNAGDIFGEIAILDGGPRSADAIAITDCELMKIERRNFMPLIRQQPDMAEKIIEVLCSRLRNTSEQIEDVIFLDLPGRLAKTLLRLSAAPGEPKKMQKVTLTQREIGQIIGMSRESTNKQLREWHQQNWIRLERGGVVVVNPAALSALIDLDPDGK
jgi:CRP/FNR family transcriptional regulator, cyclic AMP receptor protein